MPQERGSSQDIIKSILITCTVYLFSTFKMLHVESHEAILM